MKQLVLIAAISVLVSACSFYPKLIVINGSDSAIVLSIGDVESTIQRGAEFDFRFKSESMKTATIVSEQCEYLYDISDYLVNNQLLEPKEGEMRLTYHGEGRLVISTEYLKDVAAKRCLADTTLCVVPAKSICS